MNYTVVGALIGLVLGGVLGLVARFYFHSFEEDKIVPGAISCALFGGIAGAAVDKLLNNNRI